VSTKGIIHTHTLGVHTVGIGRLRIIVDAPNESKAWSGSRFVPITLDGFPASDFQVSNFDTREDAAEYATNFGFNVVDTVVN
jgi:hypothetical protein